MVLDWIECCRSDMSAQNWNICFRIEIFPTSWRIDEKIAWKQSQVISCSDFLFNNSSYNLIKFFLQDWQLVMQFQSNPRRHDSDVKIRLSCRFCIFIRCLHLLIHHFHFHTVAGHTASNNVGRNWYPDPARIHWMPRINFEWDVEPNISLWNTHGRGCQLHRLPETLLTAAESSNSADKMQILSLRLLLLVLLPAASMTTKLRASVYNVSTYSRKKFG